jgi:hypothetical protein
MKYYKPYPLHFFNSIVPDGICRELAIKRRTIINDLLKLKFSDLLVIGTASTLHACTVCTLLVSIYTWKIKSSPLVLLIRQEYAQFNIND